MQGHGLALALDSESLDHARPAAETGYRYNLNWAHDDQPVRMRTRSGETLWSIPYPQESTTTSP
jgi:hypothetical protein